MQGREANNLDRVHSRTLRDLLATAFRHRQLMIISFVGILSGAIVVALLQTTQYQAQIKILVKRERVDPIVTSEPSASPQSNAAVTEEELNSEVELLKSRDLLEKVVVACGLQSRGGKAFVSRVFSAFHLTRQNADPDTEIPRAVRKLGQDLSVEVITKTDLIAVNYRSPDPQLAARVLDSLANLYLEKHLAVHRPPGAFDFFRQQAESYSKGLGDAESRLIEFSRDGNVVSAQLEKDATLQKLNEFQASLGQTQAAIAETRQRISNLQTQASATPPRMTTQMRATDDGVLLSQLRSNLLNLNLKRIELLGKFEPGYRPVQEVENQIAQVRSAIATAEKSQLKEETTDQNPTYEWVKAELARAQTDLAGLQARADATAKNVEAYREAAQQLGRKEVIQGDLIRNVRSSEENYMLYVRKEEEARMSDALDRRRMINVAIAEGVTVPSFPVNPRFVPVLMGGLLAVFVSVGSALGAEYINSSFRTPDEIKSILNIPVIASIPKRNGSTERSCVS